MSEWQPIDTAPCGENILVCGTWPDGTPWVNIGEFFGEYALGDWDEELEPTHWAPLPAEPPK